MSVPMVPNDDDSAIETQGDREPNPSPRTPKLREYRIRVPSLQSRLLDKQALNQPTRRRRLLDFLKARPSIEWLKKIRFSSPLAIFRRTVDEREEISLSVPSPVGVRRRFQIHFIRKINWGSLFRLCIEWLKHPMNIALLLWLICVASSATMLGLLLLGLLDQAFPAPGLRNHWIEVNNQILNALFTLMSLYQHPTLLHHLVMLCGWRSEDIVELRKIYCKNSAYRPHEWGHMMVVILLLQITCLAQYIVCGLYWGFSRKTRPEFLENFFFALGIATPVFAAVYMVYSPLGREYDSDSDSDEESQSRSSVSYVRVGDESRKIPVSKPEWIGGLFDCYEDVTVGYLSFFCTCCVFGWNMERLGFGNMYVHIVTFLLLCLAPFWIFNITALHIHDYVIADVMGFMGVLLCVCGLLYGGFWRVQMRKRFKLPGKKLCCGSDTVTDYIQWFFCWSCSLAQEVRTANFYDVEDDGLYRRLMSGDLESRGFLRSVVRGAGGSSPLMRSENNTSVAIVAEEEYGSTSLIVEEHAGTSGDDAMLPPVPPSMNLGDGVGQFAMDGAVIAPRIEFEDGVMDGERDEMAGLSSCTLIEGTLIRVEDGDADTSSQPLIQRGESDDGSSNSARLIRFVQIMEYGLFFVILYALVASLVR